jgi:hypothetical protein
MTSGTVLICGHERTLLHELLVMLERHGSEPAINALQAFIGLQSARDAKSIALRSLLDPKDLAAIMTAAQQEIDPRWTYMRHRKCANEYVSCHGPDERINLTADEARWHLLLMLGLPKGSTRADFNASLRKLRT